MKLSADRHHLVTDNLKLVHKIASKMMHNIRDSALDYDDLYAMGCEGLTHAAAVYDATKGCNFSTIAYRSIQGYILKQFNRFLPIYVPAHIKVTANAIVKEKMTDATAEEVAEKFGCTVQWASNALHSLSLSTLSAQQQLKTGEDETMEIFVRTEDDDTEMIVNDFLETLSEKHRSVAKCLMRGETMSEIGVREGITFQGIGLRAKTIRKRWLEYEAAQ